MKRVILFGPAGVGKGTVAKLLCERMGWAHVSTGDLLRQHIRTETEIGKKIKAVLAIGNLAPDELVIQVLNKRLVELEKEGTSYFLDGSPRTLLQAQRLEWLPEYQVINLTAPYAVLRESLLGRLSCKGCGSVFHETFKPATLDGVCDRCQGPLNKRDDDNVTVVEQRFQVYETETAPILHYYQKVVGVHNIDATTDQEEVTTKIIQLIQD